jgi:hypothetical protein
MPLHCLPNRAPTALRRRPLLPPRVRMSVHSTSSRPTVPLTISNRWPEELPRRRESRRARSRVLRLWCVPCAFMISQFGLNHLAVAQLDDLSRISHAIRVHNCRHCLSIRVHLRRPMAPNSPRGAMPLSDATLPQAHHPTLPLIRTIWLHRIAKASHVRRTIVTFISSTGTTPSQRPGDGKA